MTAARPLDWIQEIESSLIALDEKPQFGLPATVDWQKIEYEIGVALGISNLQLTHEIKGWVDASQIFSGLGHEPMTLQIDWAPLSSAAYFIIDQLTLKEIMASLFQSEEAATYFYDASYAEGFFHYFVAEILRILEHQNFTRPLTPRLGDPPKKIRDVIGEESCFVIDLSMTLGERRVWGRVLLPTSFRKEWKDYFAHARPPALSEEMRDRVQVEINLEIAHARLSLSDWKKIKRGDFIILDRCSYDPIAHTGGVILTIKQKPIFRGRLKDGGIKITNYPLYEEVSDAMEDDDDLYEDLDENDETEFDEDEEDLFAGLEPRKEEKKSPEFTQLSTEETGEQAPLQISPEELPIQLTVEVGRIHMTVGGLMNLSPGNLLDLNVSPAQGVDLVVNGKKVGRGELIRMGDVLGVRILSL